MTKHVPDLHTDEDFSDVFLTGKDMTKNDYHSHQMFVMDMVKNPFRTDKSNMENPDFSLTPYDKEIPIHIEALSSLKPGIEIDFSIIASYLNDVQYRYHDTFPISIIHKGSKVV